jgi:hypothetical protein
MSALVDWSDAGRKASGTKLQRAARRSREARAEFWRAFIVTTFFIVVIGALLLVGAVVIAGRMQAAKADSAAASHKTARIKRPLGDTMFCQFSVFDNKSAQLIDGGVERCDVPGRIADDDRKSRFSWGGN